MTQQEFEDRTCKTVTPEEYARIEAMYMAAGTWTRISSVRSTRNTAQAPS